MLYREMPKNGDRLSILGFGCMRLPQKKGTPGEGKIDEERAVKQIRHAIDLGVNYFDTAMPYHMGGSEPFLGKALSDGYRQKIKLATKLPHWSVKTRNDMDRILDAQLKNLKTDQIDYYLIHNIWKNKWDRLCGLGITDFLIQAKKDGRIANAGFSSHMPLDEFKTIVDVFDWDFCQIQYNFLDEKNQAGREGLEYAAEKNLGVVIMEPLRGGNLVGEIPKKVQAIWDEAEVKRSPAEWALRWVWNHPNVIVLLSGMNEESHIDENIKIASEAEPNSLTPHEISLYERVEKTYRELMKVPCTGCQYCMPCPEGVNIPNCFEAYNRRHMFDDRSALGMYVFNLGGIADGKPSLASQCKECGKCAKKCPQSIPIPDMLKEVVDEFENRKAKMMAMVLKTFFRFQRWRSLAKTWRPFGSS